MEFLDKKTIKLDKIINELDKFVFKFINILKKHANYVIVSGYVAILLGRSRTTEDIDIFIEELTFDKFINLYNELKNKGFWCLNAEDAKEIYSYLKEGLAVRFAKEKETTPNFEIKFAKKQLDKEALVDIITIGVSELGKLNISSLERQIAFKRYYLKSDKDIEDAEYIETLFKDKIDIEKIDKYKKLLM